MRIRTRTTPVAALCAAVALLCPLAASAQERVGEYEFGGGYARASGNRNLDSAPGDSSYGTRQTAWVFLDVNAPVFAVAGISLNVAGSWSYRYAPNEMSWTLGVGAARRISDKGYVAFRYNPFDVQADGIGDTPWGEDFRTIEATVRYGHWRGDVLRSLGKDTLGEEADVLTTIGVRYRILGVRYDRWISDDVDELDRLNVYVAWGQWGG